MDVDESLIACPECDLLTTRPSLQPGQRARCRRCGCVLMVNRADAFQKALAYSIAGLVMICVALGFPFLSISASGVESSMTLLQTVSYLNRYGASGIAVLVCAFVIVVPVLMLMLTTLIALCLLRGRFHPTLIAPTRLLFQLNAWAMVEVFAIGVIVSLVKLAGMASVSLGASFWAYLAFAVLFLLAFSCLDRFSVWSAVDRLMLRKAQT